MSVLVLLKLSTQKPNKKFQDTGISLPKQKQHCTTTTVPNVWLIGQICMDLTKHVRADMVLSCIKFNNDKHICCYLC